MRQRLLVLGAGTAGTMVVNKLRRVLDRRDWDITVVDRDDAHPYQPGYLFLPFGQGSREQLVRSRHAFVADGVELVLGEIEAVDAPGCVVTLADGRRLPYDYLVIATGTSPRPDQTPGMLGPEWRRSIFDFYTLDGAQALAAALRDLDHGRLVVHVTDMPIKCPVAPLEFTFLADAWLRRRGLRDRVDLVYVTPLSGAFTKPVSSALLGSMLDEREVAVETDFLVEHVDDDAKALVSYDERVVPFDLLVTVPLNMGADFVGRSGLGDELNYVPVDKHTGLSTTHGNVFALGDASDMPASKAGSVAHFSVDVFVRNFLEHITGRPMTGSFDGHANCFIESGGGKGLLIDFNYDTEPLPGTFPLPVVGPLSLLRETRANHLGKLAFRWVYWNVLLPGRPLAARPHVHGGQVGAGSRVVLTVHDRSTAMPVTTLEGRTIHVNDEGFLTDPGEWDEELAAVLAARIGITLTAAHWDVLRFLRADFAERGETPTLRRVSTTASVPVKELFALFPAKPAKKMAYVAGLPKPQGCV